MNLELLDPFRKQIPDRVDSTLNLPHVLLSSKKLDTTVGAKDDEYGKAANSIAFNRRGSYIAVGYASGAVGVYDVLSRTLSSLYKHESCVDEGTKGGGGKDGGSIASTSSSKTHDHCVTALSWSRRSRTLLCGSVGSDEVRLVDTTHPFGPEECSIGVQVDEAKDADDDQRSQSPTAFAPQKSKSCSQETSFAKRGGKEHFKKPVALGTAILETKSGEDVDAHPPDRRNLVPADHSTVRRYPSVQFKFPLTVGSSLQVHPKDSCAGHAVLCDGSIAAFWVPKSGFEESTDDDDEKRPKVKIAVVFKSDKLEVTCSAFDPHGERLYAVTKGGRILGFEVGATFGSLSVDVPAIPRLKPSFVIQIPGGASAWQVVISRNGRYLVVNSADASIRLYNTKDLWTTPDEVQKPAQVFQDVVSKVKFASCDVSGDGEYIVGASQGNDTKYELYIWNTATGALMDKLTGANVELYSVAWHPTRSFLAVAASDGLVDIWGPRINWTAFAPDFQALPGNVEYVECEDEFDIVDDQGKGSATNEEYDEEDEDVDIVTIEPVPVFQSDSEDEEDVFHFATQVTKPNLGSTSAT
jgi:WD40 repeat protein